MFRKLLIKLLDFIERPTLRSIIALAILYGLYQAFGLWGLSLPIVILLSIAIYIRIKKGYWI